MTSQPARHSTHSLRYIFARSPPLTLLCVPQAQWQRPSTATSHHSKGSLTSLHTRRPWGQSCATMLAIDSMTSVNTSTEAYLSTTIAVLGLFVTPMNIRSRRNLGTTSYAFSLKPSIFQSIGTNLSVSTMCATSSLTLPSTFLITFSSLVKFLLQL